MVAYPLRPVWFPSEFCHGVLETNVVAVDIKMPDLHCANSKLTCRRRAVVPWEAVPTSLTIPMIALADVRSSSC
jgi:hypothetical protein